MAYYVCLYETDRAYGGPEEGGWWFDTGELVRAIPCYTRAKAERVLARVRMIAERRNTEDRRYPPSSVLCNGYYDAWIEDELPAKHFPQQRPHYE